jgi:TonB-dependent starch-binding outer membrane protein SusC
MMKQSYRLLRKVAGQVFVAATVLLASLGAYAQDRQVGGKVTDAADGSGLPGVSVQVKGTGKGVATGIDGSYKISAPEGATLVFSYVGYTSQEIAIGNRTTIDVKLGADTKSLEEVVVVGYGTQKRKEISGTVTSISSRDFNGGIVNNPLQAVAGKVAGLVITRPGGDPNQAPTVRLRGVGSLTAGSEPLYVVDGVPGVPINNIAPQDIETMDVLRDASSAAIYGSRAANGVIIITTKRGKAGRTTVDYNGFMGVESISRGPDIFDAAGIRAAATKLGQKIDDRGANTDWIDAITRNAIAQNHDISFGGGSEKTSFRASIGYLNQQGVTQRSGLDRLSARLNIDQRALNDKLQMGFNFSAITSKRNYAQYAAFVFAQTFLPTDPIFNPDGTYFEREGAFSQFNPVAHINGITDESRRTELRGNVNARYNITDNLNVFVNGSLSTSSDVSGFYQSRIPKENRAQKGIAARGLNVRNDSPAAMDKLLEVTLNYTKEVGPGKLSLLGGYSYQDVIFEGFSARNNNFLTDNFSFNNLGAGVGVALGNAAGAVNSFKNGYKLISFFGRAQYSMSDKYFATVNVRRDGSTKFGTNNKWGLFPSASVGWTISNEDFLKGNATVDNLKLRVNYGQTGNSEGIRPYTSLSLVGAGSPYFDGGINNFLPSYGPVQNPNPNLKWEVNESYGAGVDFSLFKTRLTGNLDVYVRNTRDLLYTVSAPQERGFVFPTILANIGSMRNSGVELALNYLVVDKQDFSWTAVVAGAYNHNEVTGLNSNEFAAPDRIPIGVGLGAYLRGTSNVTFSILQPGFSVGQLYGAVVEKIDENGRYVFKDLNADGKIEPESNDRTYLGSPQPPVTLSLNNTFRYKNFDLNFLLNSRFGNYIANTNRLIMGRQIGRLPEENALTEAVTSPVKDDRTIPSNYWVERGDFVRLDNFTLGYNLPLNSKFISRARLYVSGTNLFIITKYKGIDPELRLDGLAPGIDIREFYYKTRGFNVGVNLSF